MSLCMSTNGHECTRTRRREFLARCGVGLSGLALQTLLAEDRDPLAPKPPHFTPRAKSVIWCFMEGGPSHVDLFDPKPKCQEPAGQPLPPSFGRPITAMGTGNNSLMPAKRALNTYGQ